MNLHFFNTLKSNTMKNNFVKKEIVLLPTKNDCTKTVNQFIDNKITNEKMWELIEKQVNKSLK